MDINSSQIRNSAEDSHGVRHLKEVMRNISRLYSEATSPQAKSEGWGMSQGDDPRYAPPKEEKKVEKPKKKLEAAPVDFGQLAGCGEEDSQYADTAGDDQQGGVLRHCGARISGLCARLHTESQVPRAPLAYDNDPSSGIRIVDRPEEAASVQRARAERAAAEDIAKHAKFPLLDSLDETVNTSKSLEDLRKHFMARHRHHPRLIYLTDNASSDPGAFRSAIWNVEGDAASDGALRSGSGSGLHMGRATPPKAAAKQAGLPQRKPRFRRDHSTSSLSGG